MWLLCMASLTLLCTAMLMKFWVGAHVPQYLGVIHSPHILSWGPVALALLAAAVWLAGSLFGLVLAYRVRRYSGIRYAAIAAVLSFVATLGTCIPYSQPTVPRLLWRVLVWVPIVAALAVLAFFVVWRRERGSLLGLQPENGSIHK